MGRGPGNADSSPARAGAIASARELLVEASATDDRTYRMLLVVEAVQVAVQDLNIEPVVVGGLAVEFYTHAYSTSDVDVVMPSTRQVHERLVELGFAQESADGGVWVHEDSGVVWEMPAGSLSSEDQADEVETTTGGRVRMIRVEDLLVHRVDEFVGQGHGDVFEQVLALLRVPGLDWGRVLQRAQADNQEHAAQRLRELAGALRRSERPFPENWELHELADELRATWRARNLGAGDA